MQQAYNAKYTYLWAKFLLKMPELNTDQELTENQSEDTPDVNRRIHQPITFGVVKPPISKDQSPKPSGDGVLVHGQPAPSSPARGCRGAL